MDPFKKCPFRLEYDNSTVSRLATLPTIFAHTFQMKFKHTVRRGEKCRI